jgi:hypothetical protein
MANDLITFYCSSCGIKLTVPRELAGISGPCPSCGNLIQAPVPSASVSSPSPPDSPAAQAPLIPPPHQPAEPATLKPEPRQLPARSTPPEVVARPMPDPLPPLERRRLAVGTGRHNPRLRFLTRFLMLAMFLVASGALVYAVLSILKKQPPPVAPASGMLTPPPDKKSNTPPTDAQAPAIEPTPQLPDGLEPVSPWQDAEAVLEKFLAAKSLAERLPIIETRTSAAELASSCLAAPLPGVRKMIPELRETNPVERVIDCYFTVDFEATQRPSQAQTVLVRTRGASTPMVVVDPFLDTYGGRLAAYAANPTDKSGVFQVVVYAVASCTDPSIPNREKKLTLKLLSSDNTREIARAYFGRQSKISEMLEDGSYSLNYGNAKACTVMLRWNTEDNPDQPYLEAIAIKSLDWNS